MYHKSYLLSPIYRQNCCYSWTAAWTTATSWSPPETVNLLDDPSGRRICRMANPSDNWTASWMDYSNRTLPWIDWWHSTVIFLKLEVILPSIWNLYGDEYLWFLFTNGRSRIVTDGITSSTWSSDFLPKSAPEVFPSIKSTRWNRLCNIIPERFSNTSSSMYFGDVQNYFCSQNVNDRKNDGKPYNRAKYPPKKYPGNIQIQTMGHNTPGVNNPSIQSE